METSDKTMKTRQQYPKNCGEEKTDLEITEDSRGSLQAISSRSNSAIETSKVLVHLVSMIQIARAKAVSMERSFKIAQKTLQEGRLAVDGSLEIINRTLEILALMEDTQEEIKNLGQMFKSRHSDCAEEVTQAIKIKIDKLDFAAQWIRVGKDDLSNGLAVLNKTFQFLATIKIKAEQLAQQVEQIVQVTQDDIADSEQIIQFINSMATVMETLDESEKKLKIQYLELQNSRQALLWSEEKYRILVENSQDSIYSCDINGTFTAVNKKFCEITGLAAEQIIGKNISEIMKSTDFIGQWRLLFRNIQKKNKTRVFNTRYMRADGRTYHLRCTLSPVYDFKGEVSGVTGTNHDITELRENEQTIKHLAYYNPLTDLPNRILFEHKINYAIKQAKRNKSKIAVIFLDMDNFKNINDSLGHAMGDELIKQVSSRFKKIIRKQETIAHLSGDEFAVFKQGISGQEEILEFVARLQSVFEHSFVIRNHQIFMGCSLGLAIYPDNGTDLYELMKNADTAMYKAKEAGKNTFCFYNQDMKKEILRKVSIEKNLRKALTANELQLYYQPQVETKTGKVRGCEALLRWKSRELGMVLPSEFIPIAENTGLIIPIGEWALKTACYNYNTWKNEFGLQWIIAVNISAVQLRQNNFLPLVRQILSESKMDPEYLELEITESVLISSFSIVSEVLHELRKMGIKIALDDFGKGYSSLTYIKQLPFSTLKIDKEFVQDIKAGSKEKAISESIISLSHNLGLQVVAEGVETKEQFEFLQKLNCDTLQGYYLHKPVQENEISCLKTRIIR